MRIEDYQKWLSSQFLDEPAEEEAEPAAAVPPEEPAEVPEPVQFAPAPPPPAPAAPAWRPPSPPEEPPIPAEAVDTSQLGPAAFIGRAPAQPTRAATPQPASAEPAAPPPASVAPPVAPPPPAQHAAPPHIDTEPVYTQPARVIDESEEVAPPIDRYFRLRRPEQPTGQLPLDVAAEEPAVAPEPEPEPQPEPQPVVAEALEIATVEEPEETPEPEAEVVAEVVEPLEAEPTPLPEPTLVPEPEPVHAIVTEVARPAAAAAPEPQPEPEAAPAEAPEAQPEPQPEAPIRRARHARNVRPTEVVREMDAKTLWSLVPRHIQTLVALDSDEVTQNSYKRAFRESRMDLVQRLLDPTLSLEETSRLLNVCPTTVRRYTNRGLLTHQRTSGDQRRFKLSDVLAFLEAQQQAREP